MHKRHVKVCIYIQLMGSTLTQYILARNKKGKVTKHHNTIKFYV